MSTDVALRQLVQQVAQKAVYASFSASTMLVRAGVIRPPVENMSVSKIVIPKVVRPTFKESSKLRLA